jgi:hypothetical protein
VCCCCCCCWPWLLFVCDPMHGCFALLGFALHSSLFFFWVSWVLTTLPMPFCNNNNNNNNKYLFNYCDQLVLPNQPSPTYTLLPLCPSFHTPTFLTLTHNIIPLFWLLTHATSKVRNPSSSLNSSSKFKPPMLLIGYLFENQK